MLFSAALIIFNISFLVATWSAVPAQSDTQEISN